MESLWLLNQWLIHTSPYKILKKLLVDILVRRLLFGCSGSSYRWFLRVIRGVTVVLLWRGFQIILHEVDNIHRADSIEAQRVVSVSSIVLPVVIVARALLWLQRVFEITSILRIEEVVVRGGVVAIRPVVPIEPHFVAFVHLPLNIIGNSSSYIKSSLVPTNNKPWHADLEISVGSYLCLKMIHTQLSNVWSGELPVNSSGTTGFGILLANL